MELSLSLWWALLAIGACADRRDVLGRVSAEVARRLVTDDDRAWLGSRRCYYGGGGGGGGGGGFGYGSGGGSGGSGYGYGNDGYGYGYGSSSGDGSGSSSGSSGSNAGVYGYGGGGYGIGSDGSVGCIVSLTIDGVRRTPDEVRVWLIEMATAEQRGAGTR